MGLGGGNLQTFSSSIPGSAGPPFPLNSADNGLSVDPITRRIVLGQNIGAAGDPAQLLNNREIPLKGFYYNLLGTTIQEYIDDSVGLYVVADQNFKRYISASQSLDQFGIGDLDNAINGYRLDVLDNVQQIDLRAKTESFWQVQGITRQTEWHIGNTAMQMSEALKLIFITTDFVSQLVNMQFDGVNQTAIISATNPAIDPSLYLDHVNLDYALGDFFVSNNGVFFEAWDGNNEADICVKIGGVAGKPAFRAHGGTSQFDIGDLTHAQNGTFMRVDDAAQEIQFKNFTNNAILRMNGVPGFTGTVTPVTTITVNGGIVTNVA